MTIADRETDPASNPAWAGGPYSVKRHGVTITNCESEPVQTPGCVQAHGVLLVLRRDDLRILQVSENSAELLGQSPAELLGRSISLVVGAERAASLRQLLEPVVSERNPLYAFRLPERAHVPPLDVTAHTIDDLIVVELEATGRADGVEPDYYGLIKTAVTRLQGAGSVLEFCQVLTAEIRALTGFDRVMAYKFHADDHGEVFAESRAEPCEPWLGLHYPAEDIPKPARDVFLQVWCRPLPDVSGAVAELVPLVHPDTQRPLTMTHCALRGPSRMYIEYLQNMRVSATLTMPLRPRPGLWGLIACHHYAGPRFVPYQVRAACEFLAQVSSLLLQSVEERELLLYRLRLESVHNDLVAGAASEGGLAALVDGRPGLLAGLKADGAALYHGDRWWLVGATPPEAELAALAEWLVERPELHQAASVYVTDCLSNAYPRASAFADKASGLLAFLLTRADPNLLMWFRTETIRTVDWGGNPHDKPTLPGPHGPRLTPRASFELFRESVRLRSLPWLPVEVSAAARLRVLVMALVVGRAEHLAERNADLARSNEELDAFASVASHDLKEPLRGIHQYAHQLLEDAGLAEKESRTKLEALMRLTVRMDSLLDSLLHFSRVGQVALEFEVTDLNEVIREAFEMVEFRTSEPARELLVPRPLPRVACDRVRVREIFVNLVSNGLKYNDSAAKRIEVGYIAPGEPSLPASAPEGAGLRQIFFVRDNGIGIAAKHFDQIFEMFRRLHARSAYHGGTGAGLTIVKKLVERHGGVIWLDSEPGHGTTFYFTLHGHA
jgi:chemotaxis family two-component system sensor kinase Cph1